MLRVVSLDSYVFGAHGGQMSPVVLSQLVADAERSGLFDGIDFGTPSISDVGSTVVRFHPDSQPERTAIRTWWRCSAPPMVLVRRAGSASLATAAR